MKLLNYLRKNWLIWSILGISLILRLIYLNQSLWLDEGIEWWAVTTFNLRQLFGFMSGDFNPPAHYLVAWFWLRVFGTSEIAMRMPSVLFGVGTVWWIYKIANLIRSDLARQGQTFTAPAMAAVNGLLIYYSQEARAYAMAVFLITGAMYYVIKRSGPSYAKASKGKEYLEYLGYLGCMTAALYTHYLTWLLIPFLIIYGAKYLLPIVFTIPWWSMVWKQLQVGQMVSQNAVWAKIGETSWQNIGLVVVKFITGRIPFPENLFLKGIIVLISILIWLLIIKGVTARKNKEDLTLILWGFGPLILGGLIGMRIPIFIYFRFLFVLPAIILLAAKGLDGIRGKWGQLLKLGILGIFGGFSLLYLFNRNYHREGWKEMVVELHQIDNEPTVIMNAVGKSTFDYYDRGRSELMTGDTFKMATLNSMVWYIPYAQPIFQPNDDTRKNLINRGYVRIFEKYFNGVALEEWKSEER